MTSTAALSAHAIRKNFGRKHVLEGVDLEVAQGEVVALVGENGAGKTTLLRICAGVLPADGGRSSWQDTLGIARRTRACSTC